MTNFVILMLVCGLVTWLPRIVPFLFSKKLVFPETFTVFLSYLPLCILAALLVQNLLIFREGQFPILKVKETIACILALLVGYYTKDLMKIVITGVIAMALLRFFL
ncbi:Branched-chain amino acid transport protein (AzlD) [Enterococcus casseliflavus ATCC 12755]|uniref:Branched-chain amino acid transport protein (AzlD) n=1 Tax=Enterococcus casseliflavus ATCC 12755 TaxID=888066 RepID=F0ENM0_ENTCA|nr:AzlD domain-containing protein [Enterococcus casseliflavus]EGC68422.1 Branched-chain amino acid transport protein (AzlD) [Enterococcus casseliflavus ATCC 12755]